MKNLICLLALLVSTAVRAADCALAWDASPSPNVTNYVLYASTNSPGTNFLAWYPTALVKVNCGTNLTTKAQFTSAYPQWYFVVTAMAGGIQSDASNIVGVQVPASPSNARTVAVQIAVNVPTNFVDALYLKLNFP